MGGGGTGSAEFPAASIHLHGKSSRSPQGLCCLSTVCEGQTQQLPQAEAGPQKKLLASLEELGPEARTLVTTINPRPCSSAFPLNAAPKERRIRLPTPRHLGSEGLGTRQDLDSQWQNWEMEPFHTSCGSMIATPRPGLYGTGLGTQLCQGLELWLWASGKGGGSLRNIEAAGNWG
ncbi:glyoxylate reductase/hydroxypyruvate reductase-like [Platysternon megacephalum]|uniref:Glyoxylate reductase/hydroxypyruvate reductase-like n=1 Tax=Platysternon megacephalum TaxID=55544 RepID=A0A4D9E9C6_9SAUR|nr:glyoxylate reductase/hydroxypyruvate reductase-like [Platysternon megacephalum]